MTDWQLFNLLKKKKILDDNKYYLDGRERKVSRTRKLAVVLPFIALLLFGVFFVSYTKEIANKGIHGNAVCVRWVTDVGPYGVRIYCAEWRQEGGGILEFCGDKWCNSRTEDCNSCPADCGCSSGKYCGKSGSSFSCLNIPTKQVCGDDYCGTGEDCNNCNVDCGCLSGEYCGMQDNIYSCSSTPTTIRCGDEYCGAGQNCGYNSGTKTYKCKSEDVECENGFCDIEEEEIKCGNEVCGAGESCGYNSRTKTYKCKSEDVECENNFCDIEEEEEGKEETEMAEYDPCTNITDNIIIEKCDEEWKCDWGMCINGKMEAYNCKEVNDCGTAKYKPTYKDCVSLKSDCTPKLECGEWTECELDILKEVTKKESEYAGTKTRTCADITGCLIASSETRECEVKRPSSVITIEKNNVAVCSQNRTVARVRLPRTKHGLDIDLIFGEGGVGGETSGKKGIDWTKLKGWIPYLVYLIYIAIGIFVIKIFILVSRRRKEKMESARAVRIINHLMAKSESARLKHEREKAERYYKKAEFYYNYLAEYEKLRVIRKLKKLENKLGGQV